MAINVSRHTAVRILLELPLPAIRVPRVLGVDDFALAKRRRYAIVLIDAETRERIEVLPDRDAETPPRAGSSRNPLNFPRGA